MDIRLAAWMADGQHYRLAIPSGSEYVRLTLVAHLDVLPELMGSDRVGNAPRQVLVACAIFETVDAHPWIAHRKCCWRR